MADEKWFRDQEGCHAADAVPSERPTRTEASEPDATVPVSKASILENAGKAAARMPPTRFSGAETGSFEGVKVSHYQIGKLIGNGGMGEVYSAEDTLLNRRVAVKFLLPRPAGNEKQEAALLSEARSIASVGHPSTAPSMTSANSRAVHFLCLSCWKGSRSTMN